MPPISRPGTLVTVTPSDEIQIVSAPGESEFVNDLTPFSLRVTGTIHEDARLIGVFGPITEGGVKVFQRCANALGAGLVVDGRVGPRTLPHLRWWGQRAYETGDFIC